MKTRIIQTRFWEDDTVLSVSKDARMLWIYLLTNDRLGMTNYAKIPDLFIQHYLGFTSNELAKAKVELIKTGKILFRGDWIFIKNLERENKYKNSPKLEKPYKEEISHIPLDVVNAFSQMIDTSIDSTIDRTIDSLKNPKLINHKPKQEEKIEKENFRKELEVLMDVWNKLFGTRKTAVEPILENYKYWRKIYTKDMIKEAIQNYSKFQHKYWKQDADLMFLFRTKNKSGACDYIAEWLNLK